jgi:gamma-glutamylcyclotransferase (GGCT)/AIG2-like uncharacterized protein YtfP
MFDPIAHLRSLARALRAPTGTFAPVRHLFVYGTLLPGEVRWSYLEPFVVGDGLVDSVTGVLSDTGRGYPAASFDPDTQDGRSISGRTFELRDDGTDEALALLDEVEGAVAGLYRRVAVRTARGIDAWAYEYGGGLGLTTIESGSWLDRSRPDHRAH